MKCLSLDEFEVGRNASASSQRGLIERSIFRRRGYRCGGRYSTEVGGTVLSLYHYGTLILKVDLSNNRVLTYGGFSTSDIQMLETVFWILGLKGYEITNYSSRPPCGFTLWHDGIPMKKDMREITARDLDEEGWLEWLKRRRRGTFLRHLESWDSDWWRWAYRVLYGEVPGENQTTLIGRKRIIPTGFQRSSNGYWRNSRGEKWRKEREHTKLEAWFGAVDGSEGLEKTVLEHGENSRVG